MRTLHVAVPVCPTESVTVQRAVPVRFVPGPIVALNAVDAVEGDVIVMPAPPIDHVHANVYPGTPPVALTVVVPVVNVMGAKPLACSDAGEATALTWPL
jgi:hypothetical protein